MSNIGRVALKASTPAGVRDTTVFVIGDNAETLRDF